MEKYNLLIVSLIALAAGLGLTPESTPHTAALPNPGVSARLALAFRARLAPDKNVLILGATGVTGKLAVSHAKLLGAARVVAAGRKQQILNSMRIHVA